MMPCVSRVTTTGAETSSNGTVSGAAARAGGGLVVDGVSKGFGPTGSRSLALHDVSLTVDRGRFVTLIGPSGCGKSTLLRIIAGLLDADDGRVSIFGESVSSATKAKHIGFVPQSPA